MSPLFKEGDFLFIATNKRNNYVIGDIVVFLHNGVFVAHRFIVELKGKIYLKGDNIAYFEVKNKSDLLGKVSRIERVNDAFSLDTIVYRFVALYFTYISMSIYFFGKNLKLQHFLKRVLRGRNVLIKLLFKLDKHGFNLLL